MRPPTANSLATVLRSVAAGLFVCAGFGSPAVAAEPENRDSSGSDTGIDFAKPLIVFSALIDQQWDIFAWEQGSERRPKRLTTMPYDELRPSLSADRKTMVFETSSGEIMWMELSTGKTRRLPYGSSLKFDTQPSLSPDGRSVLLVTNLSQTRDDTDLVLVNPDSSAEPSRLSFPASQFGPAWSREGNRFAFINVHSGGWTDVASEIWTATLDPKKARQATLLHVLSVDPSWTPDGSRVLFASNPEGQYDVYSVESSTGEVVRLTDDPAGDTDPVSNPDGSSFLFVSTRGGYLSLWVQRDQTIVAVKPFGDDRVPCKDPDWK